MYVRPQYSGYRESAKRVFLAASFKCDFDHVLAKSIAVKLGYSYVLLARIDAAANRSHGSFEKKVLSKISPPLCFFDQRIKVKTYGKNSAYAARFAKLTPYSATNLAHGAMTLKQSGEWAYGLGVEDSAFSCLALTPI
ncbi:hypothetical protein MCEMSHM24_03592 [Comamonadaceae bacterium]